MDTRKVGRPKLADTNLKKKTIIIAISLIFIIIALLILFLNTINIINIKGSSNNSKVQTYTRMKIGEEPNECYIWNLKISGKKLKYQVICRANGIPLYVSLKENGVEHKINYFDRHKGYIGNFIYESNYSIPKNAVLKLYYKKQSMNSKIDDKIYDKSAHVYIDGKFNQKKEYPLVVTNRVPQEKCNINITNVKKETISYKITCDSDAAVNRVRLTVTKENKEGAYVATLAKDKKYGETITGKYNKLLSGTDYKLEVYFKNRKYSYYKVYSKFHTEGNVKQVTTTRKVQEYTLSTGKLIYPLDKNVGRWSDGTRYSKDSLHYSSGGWHGGNDISTNQRTGYSVYAMDGGTVIAADTTTNKCYGGSGCYSGNYKHYGKYVLIQHECSNGRTYYSVYGHLSKVLVKKGDIVNQGTLIAKTGNTGHSTGPHLHIGLSYNTYLSKSGNNVGYPIYNKNILSPYAYISGNKKGKTYCNDNGKNN